ncbi:CheR family methyltransferase [Cytophaga sp. FL35]|uniref:CheR family methyltransferase n=1 Tax=Cytophaga sp. FL35 TaxID=1904456 RepID=UPI0016537FCC|nr:CheR family methyltransferase [Cytophaga sp. FL35]MBC7000398.1 PAS domain-containing protein [Cytophaga sp. FL35]
MSKEQPQDFYVVGIGASAGGLKAVRSFFDNMPSDSGIAFIVVQHLSPDFKSLMPELLSSHTEMEIFTADQDQVIRPNCIYLNKRNKNLGVKDGKFVLLKKAPKEHLNLPIDILFKMLGQEYQDKSIGVILSGTGSDGSRGLRDIKEGGGTIFVQEPESAQFDGMPKSAISTNLVDYVLSSGNIADKVFNFVNHEIVLEVDGEEEAYDEKSYQAILFEIQKKTGINFKKYKPNTLLRRLAKRLSLHNINSLEDYLAYLKKKEEELEIIKQEFLIGVTNFFRDQEAFQILKESVIPRICQEKDKFEGIRIWVAGCSNGKEVYSIAMLFDDYIHINGLDIDFKIFATDIDKNALRQASAGIYNGNDAEEIDKSYLDQYFLKTGNRIQIIKRIREKVVFSYHDVTNDPPFIQVDLITCRNLLIYLTGATQQNILSNFQFALNKDAFLFLGSSESLGRMNSAFRPLDAKHRIFQVVKKEKKLFNRRSIYDNDVRTRRMDYLGTENQQPREKELTSNNELFYYKYLSKKYAPVTVFVDEDFNVQFIQGEFKRWFRQTDGMFSNNLMSLVPQELSTVIRNGVRRTMKSNGPITIKNLVVKTTEVDLTTDLYFEQVDSLQKDQNIFLIQFGESVKERPAEEIYLSSDDVSNFSKERIADLEHELMEKKGELQNVIEELETSNEELQSSNEELMSSNEELQSSNEELQSVNEELYTVNTEFQEKNKELEDLHNDMVNLLNSTDIGTLFLDINLNIRKFTPAVKRIFNLEERDLGRSIESFASEFDDATRDIFLEDCQMALEELQTFEKEICDRKKNWYLNKIAPFVTSEKRIEGVVVTFVSISDLKENELALQLKSEELAKAQEVARMGSWRLDVKTNKVFWTEELYRMYGFDPHLPPPPYTEHMKLFTKESWEELSKAVEKTAHDGTPYALELRMLKRDGSLGWIFASGNAYYDEMGEITHLRGIAQDITERKDLYERMLHEKEFSNKITELSPSGIYIYNFISGTNDYVNEQYGTILGYSMDEINSMEQSEFMELFHEEDRDAISAHMQELFNGNEHCKIEYRFRHKDGHWVWCYSVDSPFEYDDEGNVISFIGVFIDITEKKKIERELQLALNKAHSANIYKNQFLANMSHEIRTPLNGLVGFAEFLKEDGLDKNTREEYVGIIEKCSKQLLDLVNDILDLSKIEAGELDLQFGACNLNELTNEVQKTFEAIRKQRRKDKISIECYVPEDGEHIIETDSSRLRQVLINLVGNALKFTVKGSIRFGFTIEDGRVIFEVTDTGIGISKKDLEIVFDRFQRVEHKDKKQYDGTGLGLAISKGVLSLLGGSIKVASKKGVGTTFTFDIPYKAYHSEQKEQNGKTTVDTSKFENKHVLIAEDNPTNKHYLKKLFEPLKMKISWAMDGKEAVELFKNESDLSLVLMDIRMPVMDGYEAADAILKINPEARIIAQTANAMTSDRENCLEKGFVDYVAKPISKDEMFTILSKWIPN